MPDGLLRIGELAQRHGVSTATLRYYEQLGLLGQPDRSASGYRVYDSDHEERLRFIVRAKALDLSLEEIRSLLDVWDSGSCSDTREELRHLVAHKVADARRRAREAEAFASQLMHVYDRLAQPTAEATGGCICIPDLPVQPTADLEAELSRIELAACSCDGTCGWDGCACGCACCGYHRSTTAGGLRRTGEGDEVLIIHSDLQVRSVETTSGTWCGPTDRATDPHGGGEALDGGEAAASVGCACGCGV